MKLTKEHREALVIDLQTVDEELIVIEFRQKHSSIMQDEFLKACSEIDLFLAQKRKVLIEEALVNNEIDF
jgi:hypothetical protein